MKLAGTNLRRALITAIAVSSALATTSMLPLYAERSKGVQKTDPGARVILLRDGYVQTRFEQTNGMFGLSRMPEPVNGHNSIGCRLRAANDREKEVMKEVEKSRYEYLVEFMHCRHPAGRPFSAGDEAATMVDAQGITLVAANSKAVNVEAYSFAKAREAFVKETEEPLKKEALSALPKLQCGDSIDTTIGEWRVAMRPVRASSAACLRCHAGAQGGDTLGVMLYAVRPSTSAVDERPSSRAGATH